MNLEREFFCRKNKLDEKKKARLGGELAAAPLRGHFRPGRAERLSGEWAGSDAAIHAVSQARQWLRQIDFSGKRGASERAPRGAGMKIGSMRVAWAHGFTSGFSARGKKRLRRRSPSSIRSMEVA